MMLPSYEQAKRSQSAQPTAAKAYTPSMTADGDANRMNVSRQAPTAANWDFYNASKQARQQNPAYSAWNPSNASQFKKEEPITWGGQLYGWQPSGGDWRLPESERGITQGGQTGGRYGEPERFGEGDRGITQGGQTGPAPGPMTRQQREDDIYNQLMAGDFATNLKKIPSAAGRRAANAREVAKRLNANGMPSRYFDQYGVRPPGQAQSAQPPSQGTQYNPQNPPDFEGPLPGPPTARPSGTGPASGQQGSVGNYGQPFGGAQSQSYGIPPYSNSSSALQSVSQSAPPSMYGQDPLPQQYNNAQSQANPDMRPMFEQANSAWMMPKPQFMQWGQQAAKMPWGPNYGNTPDSRPAPWSQTVQGQFGNNQADLWNNISGFIQGVNNQAMQKPVGVYQGQGNPGADYAKLTYNIPQLAQQGQQMVQNGWQNPFAQQSPGEANFNSFLASQGIPPMPVGQHGPSLPANAYIKAGPDFAAPAGYAYSSFIDKNGNGAGWYDTNAMAKYSASVDAWNSGGREQAFQDSLAAINDWQNKYGAIANQYRPSMPQYTRPGAPS